MLFFEKFTKKSHMVNYYTQLQSNITNLKTGRRSNTANTNIFALTKTYTNPTRHQS